MSNMSYCRFRNTLRDLQDCSYNLEGKLSEDESSARSELLHLCYNILEEVGVDIETDTHDLEKLIKELDNMENPHEN